MATCFGTAKGATVAGVEVLGKRRTLCSIPYLIDPIMQCQNVLLNELIMSHQNELFKKYVDLGRRSFINSLTKRESFLLKIFKKLNFAYYVGSYTADKKASENIVGVIMKELSRLTKWENQNFIVTSPKIATYLRNRNDFIYNTPNHLYEHVEFIGTINNVLIFVHNDMKDIQNYITIGTVTKEFNTGVIFAEMDHNIENYKENSCEGNKTNIIASQYSCITTLGNPLNLFSHFEIIFKNKPLWRKILNIR
jgi:hypothetical protein